ncbi:rod shape-determining protein MreC [Pacificimonas sp. WHA3]|uniref:Rod shape-determining protein MreC n=1 Tax=Pacificimonas pallii TaxID=2827236 RepID=A0ABS6SGC9_9SPHN|nr:rod shape-determining protein MreC [Pacificimonas pallii]MBV7256936.1 rod shape-determining protein MreC [Pacificimonas pallii]
MGRTFLALVVGIALGLLIMSRFAPGRADSLRGVGADLVAPFWELVQVPVETISGMWNNADAYVDSARRVKQLNAREGLYRELRRDHELMRAENAELRRLLNVSNPDEEPIGTFVIVGGSGGVFSAQAIISGGARHGVEPGQPVRNDIGLIGRTLEVGQSASRVMLVTDNTSRVPVTVVRTGVPALAIGTNSATLEIDLTGPTSNDVKIGDRLTTSGTGGLFPPGLDVGMIVAIDGAVPRARPATLPSASRHVIVERPFMPPVIEPPAIPALSAPDEALPVEDPAAP